MAKTYTITDLEGKETTFDSDTSVFRFVDAFESNTGYSFDKGDLDGEDKRLTLSLRFMEENLADATKLVVVVSDKSIRLLDRDIAEIEEGLTEDERHDGLWHSRSEMLEERYGPVEEWDVSFINDMTGWFGTELHYDTLYIPTDVELFDRDISKWDVSSVEVFDCMFFQNSKFNRDISKWQVSPHASTENMFAFATAFDNDNFSPIRENE